MRKLVWSGVATTVALISAGVGVAFWIDERPNREPNDYPDFPYICDRPTARRIIAEVTTKPETISSARTTAEPDQIFLIVRHKDRFARLDDRSRTLVAIAFDCALGGRHGRYSEVVFENETDGHRLAAYNADDLKAMRRLYRRNPL